MRAICYDNRTTVRVGRQRKENVNGKKKTRPMGKEGEMGEDRGAQAPLRPLLFQAGAGQQKGPGFCRRDRVSQTADQGVYPEEIRRLYPMYRTGGSLFLLLSPLSAEDCGTVWSGL